MMKFESQRPFRKQLRKPSAVAAVSTSKRSQIGELLEQIKNTPWVGIWNLALATGGLLLVVFFGAINFLPDLDLKALAGTLASVAAIALFLVGFLGAGLMLPTLYIDLAGSQDGRIRFFEALLGIFVAFALLVNGINQSEWATQILIAIFVVPILACMAIVQYSVKGVFRKQLESVGAIAGSTLLWAIWALTIPMFYYALLVHGEGISDWEAYFLLFSFPVIFAMMSITVAKLPKANRASGRAVACVLAVLLFGFLARHPAFISQTTVSALGLSVETRPVTLVLTESGCHTVNLALEEVSCALTNDTKLGKWTDVRLISRIGAQVLLHWQSKKTTSPEVWRRVVLRKEDVLSWSYEYGPLPKSKKSSP
jgi:hypothetical protein